MHDHDEKHIPDDLAEVGALLRRERHEASGLELDDLKRVTLARSRRGRGGLGLRKGTPMRARVVTLALTALLIGGTTAGGIAATAGSNNQSSSCAQYKPGNGYGDTNHTHYGPPGQGATNPCTGSGPGNSGHH
jgi:hypothetical protein